jgi:hypothetical protein
MKIIKVAILLFSFMMISCYDEATVTVVNEVSNVQLSNISFGDYAIYNNLLPGESGSLIISEEWNNLSFPITKHVFFYMVKGGDRVYLRTKDSYKLNKNDDLTISITDDTEVVNLLNDKTKALKESLSE